MNGFNEWAVEVREDVPTRQLITDWGKAAQVFLVLSSGLTDDEWASKKVAWVAGEIGLRYLVQSRTIEWWFHQEDIREGAGLEGNPQHDPVYLTNDMAIRMLPWALGQAGLSFPGRSIQVDLEGVGGGTWHWGLEPRTTPPADKKPDAFINGRGTAFALVAGRRWPLSPTSMTATWSWAGTRRSRSSCSSCSARSSSSACAASASPPAA